MKNTRFTIAISAFSFVLLIGACNKKHESLPKNTVTEFSFPGGQLKDGKITVDPGVQVQKDPKTRKIALLKGGAGGVTIDCVCSAGGGTCFPDSTTVGPEGPTIVVCVSIDPCGRCDQYIFSDTFKFASAVATTR